MLCPRCGHFGQELGVIENGKLLSCGFCTNQWIVSEGVAVKKSEPEEKRESEIVKWVIAELTTTRDAVLAKAEHFKKKGRDCADLADGNGAHENFGAQMALYQIVDDLNARLKSLKGVAS